VAGQTVSDLILLTRNGEVADFPRVLSRVSRGRHTPFTRSSKHRAGSSS